MSECFALFGSVVPLVLEVRIVCQAPTGLPVRLGLMLLFLVSSVYNLLRAFSQLPWELLCSMMGEGTCLPELDAASPVGLFLGLVNNSCMGPAVGACFLAALGSGCRRVASTLRGRFGATSFGAGCPEDVAPPTGV